mmetsp:Transcript_47316/g.153599  ORF Transcript_47316/g.153599 Transcript_47316/m.153599 type:complete len:313 (+) Transcript_47316:1629-2567(+)
MRSSSSTRPSATHCSWARSSDPRRTRRRSVETCAVDGPFAPPGAATTESRRVRNEARERSRRSACNWLSRAHTSLVRSSTSASARRRAVCSAPNSARSFSTCCGRNAIDLPRCLKAANKNRMCRLIDSTHAARSSALPALSRHERFPSTRDSSNGKQPSSDRGSDAGSSKSASTLTCTLASPMHSTLATPPSPPKASRGASLPSTSSKMSLKRCARRLCHAAPSAEASDCRNSPSRRKRRCGNASPSGRAARSDAGGSSRARCETRSRARCSSSKASRCATSSVHSSAAAEASSPAGHASHEASSSARMLAA